MGSGLRFLVSDFRLLSFGEKVPSICKVVNTIWPTANRRQAMTAEKQAFASGTDDHLSGRSGSSTAQTIARPCRYAQESEGGYIDLCMRIAYDACRM